MAVIKGNAGSFRVGPLEADTAPVAVRKEPTGRPSTAKDNTTVDQVAGEQVRTGLVIESGGEEADSEQGRQMIGAGALEDSGFGFADHGSLPRLQGQGLSYALLRVLCQTQWQNPVRIISFNDSKIFD